MSYSIKGVAELKRRLEKLSQQDATRAGQVANRAGASHLRKAVIAAAPDGPMAEGTPKKRRRKGGTVVETPHHKIKNHVRVSKTRADKANTIQHTVHTGSAYHATFVEFGSIHNTPNPFMTRTSKAEAQAIIDIMAKAFERALTRKGV